MKNSFYKPFICLIVLSLFSFSTCRDTLTLTQSLSDGETLISPGKTFALGFFTPANSNNYHRYVGIWYNLPGQTVIWVANRKDPIKGTTGVLSIVDNGTLVLTDGANSTIIWSFALTRSITNPIGRILDTGNFVVTNNDDLDNYAWQSFDYPTDTFIPGMKIGVDLKSGLNRSLTSWSSSTDPSPGIYTFAMVLRGVPQLILWAGTSRKLRSGPWNGQEFGGLAPYNHSLNTSLLFNFVDNKEEVYYTMDVLDNSIVARTVINESGSIQLFVWLNSGSWGLYWYVPRTQCDSYLACGPSGAECYTDATPMCGCLPGFVPKMQMNWELRDWSGGCIRKTKLDCRNRTDGFVTVKQTLLPDTVSATLDTEMSLDECRANCLRNCSCTAFASADIREGGNGCITWSTDLSDILMFTEGGQDLYMRLAAADLGSISNQSHKSSKTTLAVVLGIVLGILVILVLASAIFYKSRKRRTRGSTPNISKYPAVDTIENDIELPLFDVETVITATDSFSDENKLGQGGFGPVYKGKLKEGHEIAVKRLSKTSVQGIDELMTEVKLVAKLQHRNLVRLLGCCIQGDERMLIYEYLPNKSLDAFLFDEEKMVVLDWQTRYRIILGIARGLLYLHQDSRFRIIHRDLKASNILLDNDMNPKISDFGMARIFGGDDTRTTTRKVVGTYGYMSPEYALNGIFSVKSDVFSFGVLVLEIISGKRNKGVYLSEPEEFLLGNAWALSREGNGLQLADASMNGSFSVSEVLRCINVGLLCVQERPEDRPTMSSVFLMLSNDQVSLKEPLQPGFVSRNRSTKESSSSSISSKENMHSVNDVTITIVTARQ